MSGLVKKRKRRKGQSDRENNSRSSSQLKGINYLLGGKKQINIKVF